MAPSPQAGISPRIPLKVEGPDEKGLCWPRCIYFKCNHRQFGVHGALEIRGGQLWCRWLQSPCVGPSCVYADCLKNKLLPGNRCGLVIRRVTVEKLTPDDFKLDVKLKPKLLKKLGVDDVV
jgi:hypothetical protein